MEHFFSCYEVLCETGMDFMSYCMSTSGKCMALSCLANVPE